MRAYGWNVRYVHHLGSELPLSPALRAIRQRPGSPGGSVCLQLDAGIGSTPLWLLRVYRGSQQRRVLVKLESANPTGSAKDRTALGLVRALDHDSPLRPGDVVIESTSGNLGLAMARLLALMDCRFIAVTDLNSPEDTRRALLAAGAEVVVVSEPDGTGGYLLNRLRRVRELLAANPGYRWANQYENPANPDIHEELTGPEILKQAGPDLDAVYVAVSTGGTLAGISRYLRQMAPDVRLTAVDAEGSMATGQRPARRLLSGIGASRPSSFLRPADYDEAVAVGDVQSFAICRLLLEDTGLSLGGSSGSVLCAWLRNAFGPAPAEVPVCLMADGGGNYQNTFYDDTWLVQHGVLGEVRRVHQRLRARGLSFELRQQVE